jgi:hypothetical protein
VPLPKRHTRREAGSQSQGSHRDCPAAEGGSIPNRTVPRRWPVTVLAITGIGAVSIAAVGIPDGAAAGGTRPGAPKISWRTPTAGATVSGVLRGRACMATVSGRRAVRRVTFFLDARRLYARRLDRRRGSGWRCRLNSRIVRDGWHTLRAVARDAAGKARSASIRVNVANNPRRRPTPPQAVASAPATSLGSDSGLVAGIDGHYSDWPSDEVRLRASLGAPVTRHEFDPAVAVAAADGLVLKAARDVRTLIHALIGGNELGDPGAYRDYVVAFIRRYGVSGSFWREHPELDASKYAIRTFELGNEPYFGAMSAAEYAAAVRPTLEAVRGLGLPAKIVLPSRIYGGDTGWIDTLYARLSGLNGLVYAFADHPYWYGHAATDGGPAGPLLRVEALRRRMNEHGAAVKPIFITEYGQSTARCGAECMSEKRQAEDLAQLIDIAAARRELGIELVTVYQLQDRGTNSRDRELQFGIARQDGSPKPAWDVVRERAQRYR